MNDDQKHKLKMLLRQFLAEREAANEVTRRLELARMAANAADSLAVAKQKELFEFMVNNEATSFTSMGYHVALGMGNQVHISKILVNLDR